jgi:arginyl-tRNA synthetase
LLRLQDNEVNTSRLLLCDAAQKVLAQCLGLLGIRTIDRM